MNLLRLLAVPTLLFFTGCGGGAPDDLPELGRVKGVVKLQGKPVPQAIVMFRPVDGGLTSQAVTNDDGAYELNYLREMMGAKVGEHFVRITTYEDPVVEDNGKQSGGRTEMMPSEYAGGVTVKKTVNAGENVIDFEL